MATDNDTKPCDQVSFTLEAYEAFAELVASHHGHDSHTLHVLEALNRQFRSVVASLDSQGLLS